MPLQWTEVVDYARALPHVDEIVDDNRGALAVGDQMFARDEGDSVIVRCSPFEADALLNSGDPAMRPGPMIDGIGFIRIDYSQAALDSEILEIVVEGWRIAGRSGEHPVIE
jgi:hypothetical protein